VERRGYYKMTIKRFLSYCLVTFLAFILGYAVGRYVMPPQVEIIVVDMRQISEEAELLDRLNSSIQRMLEEQQKSIELNKDQVWIEIVPESEK